MKRFIVLFLVIFFISLFSTYGQLIVADLFLQGIMEMASIEQALSYAQMIQHNVEQIKHTIQMVQHMEHQIKTSIQNLGTITDISNWNDFMNWYNRQLYLERTALHTFENMNVQIGRNSYHLTDIVGIAQGYSDQTREFWNNEFTEEQRRAMWLNLGLTPSNYAFVQPFRQRAMDLAIEGITAREIQNDWYVRNMMRNNERLMRITQDQFLAPDDKMGDKDILMLLLESSMENNKVLNDIAMQNASMFEIMATEYFLDQTPYDIPPFSEWSGRGFGNITGW
jgi:hypothetical protein